MHIYSTVCIQKNPPSFLAYDSQPCLYSQPSCLYSQPSCLYSQPCLYSPPQTFVLCLWRAKLEIVNKAVISTEVSEDPQHSLYPNLFKSLYETHRLLLRNI